MSLNNGSWAIAVGHLIAFTQENLGHQVRTLLSRDTLSFFALLGGGHGRNGRCSGYAVRCTTGVACSCPSVTQFKPGVVLLAQIFQ